MRDVDRTAISAIAALDDDVRAALYEYVRSCGGPVTRECAASAVGISRNLAAFHLDKLVAVGLLAAGVDTGARRVGRAPKVYRPADEHVELHLPARSPGLLAEILVDAVVDGSAGDAVLRAARRRGAAVGQQRRQAERPGRLGAERAMTMMCGVLAEQGFEPARDDAGVTLRNCPFHPLAIAEPELVCGLNHAFVSGLVEGLDAPSITAELAPQPGHCCVALRAAR
jgi:predicted ArsR family transcriptional regulator